MAKNKDILVIGAGLAGIEISLLCANAGRKVCLVERESYFGGSAIKSEEIFPLMECATCMLAPKQSELLENKNIELLTISEVKELKGDVGNFTVQLRKKARYVNIADCIGCGACFDPCPVAVDNEFEEMMAKRKAIYLPCAGALPNVPTIDMEYCLRAKGEDCHSCKDACMFDAIKYDDQDEDIAIQVGAIIVATGFKLADVSQFEKFGYGNLKNVFHAFEFERLRASNGPTAGTIQTRDGKQPKRIGLIHCVGRDSKGYCSQVCCMYLIKFADYALDKLDGVKVYQFYKELSIPGKGNQKFFHKVVEKGVEPIRIEELSVSSGNTDSELKIVYKNGNQEESVDVDMVVLAPPIEPNLGTTQLAKILNLELDNFGFFKTPVFDPLKTIHPGIFVAGCAEGPKFIQDVIINAEAIAGAAIKATED